MKSAIKLGLSLVFLSLVAAKVSAQTADDKAAHRAAMHQAWANVKAACAADEQKLCPNLQGPQRHQCMHSNLANLSQGCQQAISQLPMHMHHHHVKQDAAAAPAASSNN